MPAAEEEAVLGQPPAQNGPFLQRKRGRTSAELTRLLLASPHSDRALRTANRTVEASGAAEGKRQQTDSRQGGVPKNVGPPRGPPEKRSF